MYCYLQYCLSQQSTRHSGEFPWNSYQHQLTQTHNLKRNHLGGPRVRPSEGTWWTSWSGYSYYPLAIVSNLCLVELAWGGDTPFVLWMDCAIGDPRGPIVHYQWCHLTCINSDIYKTILHNVCVIIRLSKQTTPLILWTPVNNASQLCIHVYAQFLLSKKTEIQKCNKAQVHVHITCKYIYCTMYIHVYDRIIVENKG